VGLFNEMARTYGAVNLVSSFGFSHFWRKACVRALALEPAHACADLMSGMGEATLLIARHRVRSIQAVDFCPAMVARAHAAFSRHRLETVQLQQADVLRLAEIAAFDRVCVSFGVKTLDDAALAEFARLLQRLLKPGGRAALVEIAIPTARLLRAPYLFYLRHVIPFIGRLCLGNPDCYRSLAIYTESFARRQRFAGMLTDTGFTVSERRLFFGCAQLWVAHKVA